MKYENISLMYDSGAIIFKRVFFVVGAAGPGVDDHCIHMMILNSYNTRTETYNLIRVKRGPWLVLWMWDKRVVLCQKI